MKRWRAKHPKSSTEYVRKFRRHVVPQNVDELPTMEWRAFAMKHYQNFLPLKVVARRTALEYHGYHVTSKQVRRFLHSIERDPSTIEHRKYIKASVKKLGYSQRARIGGFMYYTTSGKRDAEKEREFEEGSA